MPALFGLYFLLPEKWRNLWIVIGSMVFYAWGEVRYLPVMVLSATLDYVCGCLIGGAWKPGEVKALEPGGPRTTFQRVALISTLTTQLGLLAFFKYFNFALDNYAGFAALLGFEPLNVPPEYRPTLPLGISFYTFMTMSYTIDVYRGHTKATRNFIDYACYVTLFPHLIAGPIVRYMDIERELRRRLVTVTGFTAGTARFILGLAKKVLIANVVALPADRIFALADDQLTAPLAWLGLACYTVQIYFDFSGYSDMAVGMALMLGFHFPENFNYPYSAKSMTDFWHRWHMSLSVWLRDFLYIPLGGSRRGPTRTSINLLIVFFLCGLWHGASWSFVVWGLYHGAFLSLERMWRGRGSDTPGLHLAGRVYVMLVAMGGWVLFRCDSLARAMTFFETLCGGGGGGGTVYDVGMFADAQVWAALIVGSILSFPVLRWIKRVRDRQLVDIFGKHGLRPAAIETFWALSQLALLAGLFIASAMQLASGSHNPFIYFRF